MISKLIKYWPIIGRQLLSSASSGVSLLLKQSAIPVIIAPNGTVAANGTITLVTALPTTYTRAWVRLPASAVVGGLAGLYYATFISTTVGSIKTNFADAASSFTPYIPESPVAAVGSGAAYTQTTAADITLANITVPGGFMGANGSVRSTLVFANNNSANTKTLAYRFASVVNITTSQTTSTGVRTQLQTSNRGSESLNYTYPSIGSCFGPTSNPPPYTTVDTSANQSLTLTGQLAVATDYVILEGFTVEVLPA